MTTEIIKASSRSVEEIRNMSKDQLEQYAENKSKEILSLIQESCEKVADAKRDAEYAEGMKIGWFGRSKAKTDAVASALLRTNEAVAELTNLQKEIITFTCVTAEFAHVMHQTMARLMATGFRDVNGNLRQLDENSQEFAQHILDEADKFVKNQKDFESKLNKLESTIIPLWLKIAVITSFVLSVISIFISLAKF